MTTVARGYIVLAAQRGEQSMSTVSRQVDDIAPAPLGAWLEGEAEILRATGRILFTQARAGKPLHHHLD